MFINIWLDFWNHMEIMSVAQGIVAILCILGLYFFLRIFPKNFPKQTRQFHDFYFGVDRS